MRTITDLRMRVHEIAGPSKHDQYGQKSRRWAASNTSDTKVYACSGTKRIIIAAPVEVSIMTNASAYP